MNTYKKLIGNSAVFAIGNLGSKLVLILLVPLYTYYLSTVEYGMIDIVTTTTSMLLPIISLSIFDAVLRFVMDKDQAKDSVITNALMVTIIGSVIAFIFYPILKYFNVLDGLLGYMYVILILQAFQSMFAQFVRAIGQIKAYSLNGIFMTIITSIMNIILIVKFNKGISGYLISIIIANLTSIIFLNFFTKTYKYIKIDKLDKELTKRMLIYCVPLIPNTFMWWIMNASSRYFILFFVGASANGLFAVANKIPSLLSILNSIFFQAWQLSAIEEYNSKDKSKFYSQIFDYFSMVMFLATSGILMILKYLIRFAVASEFYPSWKSISFLLLGVVFSSFAGFLGTNYIAAKQTKGVFRTSLIGGILNVICNLIFVPLLGTIGAGISTMISFFVIWIMRVHDTRQFITMKLNIKNITMNLLLIFIQIFVLYFNLSSSTEFTMELLSFVLLILVNRSLFRPIKQIVFRKLA